MFRLMAKQIALNKIHVTWVEGGFGDSQQIKKGTLKFKVKSWWTLAQHRICLNTGDNVLSLVREAIITSFTISYAFDIIESLAREIRDRVVGGQKELLAYLCMITYIYLKVGVLKIPRSMR